MPTYMIISIDIVITMRFSINCSTIICLPTVCYFKREASSQNYGTRVYLLSYYFQIYKIQNKKFLAIILFNFAYFSTFPYFYIHHYQISSLQVTVKGWTTPLSRWVQVFVCLCRCNYWRLVCSCYWIDTLVLN